MRLGGEGRFDWRRQTLWVGLLALAFFVGAVVWQHTSGPSNGQEVFHMTRGAGSVVDDVSLDRLLGGVAALPADAGVVAYCVNGWYWATDVIADTNVVVASADRYYHAAASSCTRPPSRRRSSGCSSSTWPTVTETQFDGS